MRLGIAEILNSSKKDGLYMPSCLSHIGELSKLLLFGPHMSG